MAREVRYGSGKGMVFPHQHARLLLNPLRRLVQPPGRITAQMQLEPRMEVLEIGPGPGYFSVELSRRVPGGRVVLLDLQAEMLAMALARVRRAGGRNATGIRGDALGLPFRDQCFDRVLLVAVLGEVPGPADCLREVRRVLKPGGLALVGETRGDPDRISPGELRTLAERAGFSIETGRSWSWAYSARLTSRT